MSQICPTCLARHPADFARCPSDGEKLLTLELGDGRLGTLVADRYVIVGILGQGGMGMVYRAWQRSMSRFVALKTLHGAAGGTMRDALEKRFAREARATAALSSPNTVTVFDFGTLPDGSLFLVMELLEGVSLSALVEVQGPLQPAMARDIGMQICRSLSEAHAQGIVHRDIKPSNVLVGHAPTGELHVKVLDFGIAKVLDEETTDLTGTGATLGSISYMSPEQIDGRAVGPPADIYSLGVTLFDVLTDSLPFDAPTRLALMFKHLSEPPPSLMIRLGDSALVQAFDAVLQRCLEKATADRYGTIDEVYLALAGLELGDLPQAPLHVPLRYIGEAPTGFDDTAADATSGSLDTLPEHLDPPKSSTTRSEIPRPRPVAPPTRARPATDRLKFWVFPAILAVALLAYLALDALVGKASLDDPPTRPSTAMARAGDAMTPPDGAVTQTGSVAVTAVPTVVVNTITDTTAEATPTDDAVVRAPAATGRGADISTAATMVADTVPAVTDTRRRRDTARKRVPPAPKVKVVASGGLVDKGAGESLVRKHAKACAARYRPSAPLDVAVTSRGVRSKPASPKFDACLKARLADRGLDGVSGQAAYVKIRVSP